MLGAAVHKLRGGKSINSYETVGEVLRDIAAALPGAVVIADMEAGLEHLGVGNLRDSELLLVVAEANAKSLLTASRTIPLARALGIRRVELVAARPQMQGEGALPRIPKLSPGSSPSMG